MRITYRNAFIVVLFLIGPEAVGANFTVNKFQDSIDVNPGNGFALDAIGFTSLRAAIMEANALPGDDVITLPFGNYTLSIAGTGEDGAATGDLDVTSNITINGGAANNSVIKGGNIDRVFHVLGGSLTLDKVTVRDGTAPASEPGGGIFNAGRLLTVTNAIISDNAAYNGAAIASIAAPNQTCTLTIQNSTIWLNDAGSNGGGIYNASPFDDSVATANVASTRINENSAVESGTGILNYAEQNGVANLTMTDTELDANNAVIQTAVGALANFGEFGGHVTVTMTRCSVSNHNSPTGASRILPQPVKRRW